MTRPSRVLIIGGGYAGVMAANRLCRRPDLEVSLLNPRPDFVERIRLHQLVTGGDDAVADFGDLLTAGVRLVVGTAHRIDTAARQVLLTGGEPLPYDYLVYAVGSSAAVPEWAYGVADLEQAQRLRAALDALPREAPVRVVGAGLTGIETAAELAEHGRRVTLICGPALGPSLSVSARRAVGRRLRALGVDVREGVRAEDADTGILTVWTAGFTVPGLAAASGLRTDELGRLLTDETLTSVDDDRIVAAGDAAAPSGTPLRMSCQAALPLGAQAANTVLARITGERPRVIDQAFTGQCISLGRRGGTIQLARRDDTPLPVHIGGRTAAAIKEVVCRSTLAFLRREARRPGSYVWLKGGSRPAVQQPR